MNTNQITKQRKAPATLPGYISLDYQRSCELAVIRHLMELEHLEENVRCWIVNIIEAVDQEKFNESNPNEIQ